MDPFPPHPPPSPTVKLATAYVTTDSQINTSAILASISGAAVLIGYAWLRGWMGVYQKRVVGADGVSSGISYPMSCEMCKAGSMLQSHILPMHVLKLRLMILIDVCHMNRRSRTSSTARGL